MKDFHDASETATLKNRDLLQYGGGVAALLGISGGSGGVFAVAKALQMAHGSSFPLWLWAILGMIVAVALAFGSAMVLLGWRAFADREAAEQRAEEQAAILIEFVPECFIPRVE